MQNPYGRAFPSGFINSSLKYVRPDYSEVNRREMPCFSDPQYYQVNRERIQEKKSNKIKYNLNNKTSQRNWAMGMNHQVNDYK